MESGNPDKQQVRVTILNQTYSLRTSGDASEAEHLAQTVDDLMTSIARHSGNLDSTRVAVLACLHMADRLRTLERDLEALRTKVTRKTRDFTLLLDQAIGSD